MPKLTKSIVDAAKPRDRQYTIWCDHLTGFGISINPSGSKSYLVDYRNSDGKRRRGTIGRHGIVTCEQARTVAMAELGRVALQNDDPIAERRTRRKSKTIAELCDDYMKAATKGVLIGRRGTVKKPSTLEIDAGRIERHIKPLIGSKRVIDLRRSDIVKFIRDVQTGKTATTGKSEKLRGRINVTGGPGTAARTAGLLSGIMSYAVSSGIIDVNPVHGVERPKDGRRNRRLTAVELRALGAALEAAEAEAWQATAGIWLLALTGCRLGEIRALKWTEVDLDGHCLRLGDTKTGESLRPLGGAAEAILRRIERTESEFVLYGVREPAQPYGSLDNALGRITAAAKLEGVTAHILRHTFSSIGADLGFADSTIGAIIGHAGTGITSRYIHRLDSVLIAAADKIADEVLRQMSANDNLSLAD